MIHQLAEQNRFGEIDLTQRWPVYWFINGRAAPDDLAEPFVGWLPHQPYNCTPRITPGQKILVRIIGGDQDQHPLHLHGNHYWEIARYGRMLKSDGIAGPDLQRGRFTTLSVPGQTVDALFGWTGEKLGWDIYGTPADGMPAHTARTPRRRTATATRTPTTRRSGAPTTASLPGGAAREPEPGLRRLVVRQPLHGRRRAPAPGRGRPQPVGGFFFMWHSHTEKELTNFDIFPGGMLSMMVIEPPGTPID
jgi:manganese oxidase